MLALGRASKFPIYFLTMKSIQIPLLTFFLMSMTLIGQSQSYQHPINKTKQLPGLIDWFLATGNWQNDPQLYVREFGVGPDTIVMLHGGWGGEHSGLIEVVQDLGNQYHFIFYDQRGSLRSPFPDSLITFDHHIDDLELLRKEMNLGKLHIVGHSMGAILASAYASKYPQRIKQLTLISPPSLKDPIPQEDKDLHHQEYLSLQVFLNRPEVTQELEKYALNRKIPPLSSREETSRTRINLGARMLFDISKWSLLTGGQATYKAHVFPLTAQTYPKSGWNYLQEFKTRTYPVSIIIGDHDFLDFGNNLIKKWVTGIPQIKLTTIKNAGHIPWIDQPEVFTRELLWHLKR